MAYFSGSAVLDNNRWWVLATASFMHDDWSHCINNLLMFIPFAPALEHFTGHWQMFGLFILIGIFGWTASFCWGVYKYGENSKWIVSCGSSGSFYGLNTLFCM